MNTEDLIKGAERVRLMNQVLVECTVEELEFLLKLLPITIAKKYEELKL